MKDKRCDWNLRALVKDELKLLEEINRQRAEPASGKELFTTTSFKQLVETAPSAAPDIGFAFGFLSGAATALDLTLEDLLQQAGVRLDGAGRWSTAAGRRREHRARRAVT